MYDTVFLVLILLLTFTAVIIGIVIGLSRSSLFRDRPRAQVIRSLALLTGGIAASVATIMELVKPLLFEEAKYNAWRVINIAVWAGIAVTYFVTVRNRRKLQG
jgi:hypothetical protein